MGSDVLAIFYVITIEIGKWYCSHLKFMGSDHRLRKNSIGSPAFLVKEFILLIHKNIQEPLNIFPILHHIDLNS